MEGSGETFGRRSHYGLGPKGYQRSDDRLREEISDRLMAHPYIDASQVSVEVKSGEVTLEGTVEDRRTKREIEDLIEDVMGVKDTTNRLRVQAPSGRFGQSESESQSWQKSGSTEGSMNVGSSQKSGKSHSS